MQMMNELGRDADFDEQSGRQKQEDARQGGIGRCAFLALNIVCHDHTTAIRSYCVGLRSASRCGICAKEAIGIPDGKAGDAIKAA